MEKVSKYNLLTNSFIIGFDDLYKKISPRNYLIKSQFNKLEKESQKN